MADYTGQELIPPEGHKDVGTTVFRVLGEVIDDKTNLGLHKGWVQKYKLKRNHHWNRKSTNSVPLTSANLIHTHLQRTKNTLTDNNPTFNVAQIGEVPEEQKDTCLKLQKAAEHWWEDQEQQHIFGRSVDNGEVYSVAIEKVIFNPEMEYGIGEAETINVDPFQFGWYPVKLTDPKDVNKCDAVLHFYPMTVRAIKRKWPETSKTVVSDQEFMDELNDTRRELTGTRDNQKANTLLVSISNVVHQVMDYFGGSAVASEEALVCECWCHDYTTTKAQETDEQSGQVTETEEPKYPGNIRCITATNGGRVVLADVPNPSINPMLPIEEAQKTYLFDKYPFSVANSLDDTSNAWGLGDIEQIQWLNMEINKTLSQFVHHKDKVAGAKLINPLDSGVPNDQLTNYASILNPISAEKGQGIRYMSPPEMPVDLLTAIDLLKQMFFLVAGTFELDQAKTPGKNVIAYKALAALLEIAQTMMKGKLRSYSRLIRDRGRMYLSHVMNWYTEDRWIEVAGADGNKEAMQIRGTELIVPAKLTVVSGSTMPISKIQQREEAIQLYSVQAIDRQALLERLEFSGRAEIINRMNMGPLSDLMTKLRQVGMHPDMLDFLQALSQAEGKNVKKMIESGEIPNFQEMLSEIAQGQAEQSDAIPPEAQAELAEKDAEIQKLMAEAERIRADKDLILAKIDTEKVDQQVKLAGTKFDQDKLAIERARVVADIDDRETTRRIDTARTAHEITRSAEEKEGVRHERGVVSNNE